MLEFLKSAKSSIRKTVIKKNLRYPDTRNTIKGPDGFMLHIDPKSKKITELRLPSNHQSEPSRDPTGKNGAFYSTGRSKWPGNKRQNDFDPKSFKTPKRKGKR